MGSGSFAVPSLRALLASPSHEVVALVTQPDKPAGRGHRLRLPPTKHVAIEHGLDVHQPARVRHPEAVELVRELAPTCIVVVAYGQIIPKSILDIPPKGIINVHASLLPRYRGAAPIQWAIARGETETGVSTMVMDEGLDTGPVLLQEPTPIGPDETSSELEPRLAALGVSLLGAHARKPGRTALSYRHLRTTPMRRSPLVSRKRTRSSTGACAPRRSGLEYGRSTHGPSRLQRSPACHSRSGKRERWLGPPRVPTVRSYAWATTATATALVSLAARGRYSRSETSSSRAKLAWRPQTLPAASASGSERFWGRSPPRPSRP